MHPAATLKTAGARVSSDGRRGTRRFPGAPGRAAVAMLVAAACGLLVACGGLTEQSAEERAAALGNPVWDASTGEWIVPRQDETPAGTGGDGGSDAQVDLSWQKPWAVFSGGHGGQCEGSCSLCDPQTGVCYVVCRGRRACLQADLVCPDGHPCRVICEGDDVCLQADIICPPSFPCKVTCDGDGACAGLDVSCEANSPCAIDCSASTCVNAYLACEGPDCVVECSDEDSCRDLNE